MKIEEISLIIICIIFILSAIMIKGKGDFFLGKKNNGVFKTTLTITASWIGVTSMLVLSNWIFELGQAAVWYLISPGIGLIVLGLVGTKKIRSFEGIIIGDYFEKKALRNFITILIILIYTLVLGAQIVGFAKVSEGFNVTYLFGLILSCVVIVIYIGIGGFDAVATTDVIQFFLIFLSIIGMFFIIPIKPYNIEFNNVINPFTLKSTYGVLFIILGLMMFVAQENHQRIKAAENVKVAKVSLMVSGILILLYTLAILLLTVSIGKQDGNPIIVKMHSLNLTYKIIFSIGLLGAALSTADTALNISSYSIFSLLKRKNKRTMILWSILVINILISGVIAHFIPSISKIILVSVNLYVGLLFPLMLSIYFKSNANIQTLLFVLCILGFIFGIYIKPEASGLISLSLGLCVILLNTAYLKFLKNEKVRSL